MKVQSYSDIIKLIWTLIRAATLRNCQSIIRELGEQHGVKPLFEKECPFKTIVSDPDAWLADIGMSNEQTVDLIMAKDFRPRVRFCIQSIHYGAILITFVFDIEMDKFMFDAYEVTTFNPKLDQVSFAEVLK